MDVEPNDCEEVIVDGIVEVVDGVVEVVDVEGEHDLPLGRASSTLVEKAMGTERSSEI
jgi:hypothetical protein